MTSREAATIRARRLFKEKMNLPNNPSEATRKRNPHLFKIHVPEHHDADKEIWKAKMPQIIRQSHKPAINKTEREWLDIMTRKIRPDDTIYAQAINFTLANGCRYRPDFIVFYSGGLIEAWEVKGAGPIRDDSIVKLKTAAAKYRMINWWLARKTKQGWQEQRILP
jgi:hypothetical protein